MSQPTDKASFLLQHMPAISLSLAESIVSVMGQVLYLALVQYASAACYDCLDASGT